MLQLYIRSCIDNPAEGVDSLNVDALALYWLCALLLLAVVSCSLSAYLFTRVDLASRRIRIKNLTIAFVVLLCYSTLIFVVGWNREIASLVGTWTLFAYQFPHSAHQPVEPMRSRGGTVFPITRLLSDDARYLVVPEYLTSRPWFSRVTIVDVLNGQVLNACYFEGLAGTNWHHSVPRSLQAEDTRRSNQSLTVVTISSPPFRLLSGDGSVALHFSEMSPEEAALQESPMNQRSFHLRAEPGGPNSAPL